MTHEVRIAANKLFDSLPHLKLLPNIWKDNLLLNNLVTKRKLKCHCDDNIDTNIPLFYPIFPSTGESIRGIYDTLPFAYISWKVNSKTLPYIEVIEVPICFDDFQFKCQEKEIIEKGLSPHGKVVIGSYNKVTDANFKNEMISLRKRVLTKIYEFCPTATYICLSIFSNLPKSLVEEKKSRYLTSIDYLEKQISWEFQSDRFIPIKYQNKVLLTVLKSWILTQKDLKL
ncbi:hypothetical protein [Fluviispira sanaruensis]|uniref:Uncharacterized protein n=1 Tax=Fluviispira sanaruensis TaxID=2493639 RepID=A0A4P2VIM0_FLUSA|nr:hypothetical protein [Fluviispira sanaruensis]BBH51714.1 hypothetical protein JCM31447_01310 [Fluviispira sanaruensis]